LLGQPGQGVAQVVALGFGQHLLAGLTAGLAEVAVVDGERSESGRGERVGVSRQVHLTDIGEAVAHDQAR
jgi:hypothetical protein